MLVNFTIQGNIYLNKIPIKCYFYLKNLRTDFISKKYPTELGYYSINLMNFHNNDFKNGDILILYFLYENKIYNFYLKLNLNNITFTKNVIFKTLPLKKPELTITQKNNVFDIKFFIGDFHTIIFELYYYFNNNFHIIDSKTLNKNTLKINFLNSGRYLIKVLGFSKDSYLGTAKEEIEITEIVSNLIKNNDRRYIEWM